MTQYIQKVVRHEKTAKGPDGKKLDMPTPEGFAAAYVRGMELRKEVGSDMSIVGRCNKTYRTYAAANAWLTGAGIQDRIIRTDPQLNPPFFTDEQFDQIRNEPDKMEQVKMLYNDFQEQTTASGLRVARHLLLYAKSLANFFNKLDVSDKTPPPCTELLVINVPPLAAAREILQKKPVSYESVMESGGIPREGEGFSLELKKKGSLFTTTLSTPNYQGPEMELTELEAIVEMR